MYSDHCFESPPSENGLTSGTAGSEVLVPCTMVPVIAIECWRAKSAIQASRCREGSDRYCQHQRRRSPDIEEELPACPR
jgi:hypothetical protein